MITGLIGINGSGKTTRLKNLYAQHAPGAAQFVPDNPIIPIEVSAHELLHRLGRMHRLPRAEAKRRATILCDELLSTVVRPAPSVLILPVITKRPPWP